MKKWIFIDNFRGFKNAFIPLADVNFLVGQNSTGKTSILGLLKILSAPRLLFAGEFGDDEISFGHFKDMVSAHAEDRSYFRIGSIEERPGSKKHGPMVSAQLFTYKEHDGLPRLFRVTSIIGDLQVSLRFSEKQTWYKSKTLPAGTTAEDVVKTIMPQWISDHGIDGPGYKKLSLPKGLPNDAPLFFLMSFAIEEAVPREPKRKGRPRGISIGETAFLSNLVWVAPIRSKPRRTYDELQIEFSSEGSHTPYLIRRILQSKSEAKKFLAFIHRVGHASGLFQSVEIKNFGRGTTAPFEVDIVLDEKALNLSTVGYGVSQSLPVFVELLARPRGSWFAIQQPEVHLHPRAQAALGDVFFEMATDEKKRFLIETHSDFTIDRFRMKYRRKQSKKPDSQILFFERRNKQNTVVPLKIGPRGELPSDQPSGYRQFFLKEELRLLGL